MATIKLQEEMGFAEFSEMVEDTLESELIDKSVDDIDPTDATTTAPVSDESLDSLDEQDEDFDDGLPKKEAKTLYVTNKDLLAEIHKSKMSYCEIVDQKYFHYDAIVNTQEEITQEVIDEARARRAKRLTIAVKTQLKESGAKPQAVKDAGVLAEDIPLEDLTFRVMHLSHIPLDPTRKRKGKGPHSLHVKTQFLPFMHMAYVDGVLTEVARSHWKGDFQTGEFCLHRGKITNNLAKMFMMLVDRYGRRSNWRSYTYLDEMKGHALLQLAQIGLQFNEAVGDNPFAFYTTSAKNCLAGETKILTKEFGEIEIEKVAGTDVTLLDGNGDWVMCHIHDHGEQTTIPVTFTLPGGHSETIYSTANHGWFHKGLRAYETADFDRNSFKVDNLTVSRKITNMADYRDGVLHGIIYGDGSKTPKTDRDFFIRLCKNKHSLESWFEGLHSTTPESYGGDKVFKIKNASCNLKEFPENPGGNLDYLLGFMRGWMATDGCVTTNMAASICSTKEGYDWVKQYGMLVGWKVGNYAVLQEETNFGKRNVESINMHFIQSSMVADDFLNARHAGRWEEKVYEWTVCGRNQDYSKTRFEKVYCPVVETTGSFSLASGIHSANCFTRMLNLEKKNQNIRDDILIMCGSTPSFTRQNDEEHARVMRKENERMGIVAAEIAAEEAIIDGDDTAIDVVDETELVEQTPVEIAPKQKEAISMYDSIIVHN